MYFNLCFAIFVNFSVLTDSPTRFLTTGFFIKRPNFSKNIQISTAFPCCIEKCTQFSPRKKKRFVVVGTWNSIDQPLKRQSSETFFIVNNSSLRLHTLKI